jgi:hypothetical protein
MKVRDLLNGIKQLKSDWLIENSTELIFSIDDEGNSYHPVVFWPSVWYYDPDEREFYTIDNIKDWQMERPCPNKYKALCIN